MTALTVWTPPPARRLPMAASLGMAILLHLLILTLFLSRPISVSPTPRPPPILQIDLTPRAETAPPERPDRLAEQNQRSEETRAPQPPLPEPRVIPLPQQTIPAPALAAPEHKLNPPATHAAKPAETRPPAPQPAPRTPAEATPPPAPPEEVISMTELGLQSARLQAEIIEQGLRDEIASRSRVLSANTVAGPEAAYLRAWVEKIERIGNISYPDEARRRNLSGRLVLEVVVDAWGEVQSLRVRTSSGEGVLDRAAQDIARLAAPYPAFPPELRAKYDQLTIVRTWAFVAGSGLNTR